jgi:hypothetical protein
MVYYLALTRPLPAVDKNTGELVNPDNLQPGDLWWAKQHDRSAEGFKGLPADIKEALRGLQRLEMRARLGLALAMVLYVGVEAVPSEEFVNKVMQLPKFKFRSPILRLRPLLPAKVADVEAHIKIVQQGLQAAARCALLEAQLSQITDPEFCSTELGPRSSALSAAATLKVQEFKAKGKRSRQLFGSKEDHGLPEEEEEEEEEGEEDEEEEQKQEQQQDDDDDDDKEDREGFKAGGQSGSEGEEEEEEASAPRKKPKQPASGVRPTKRRHSDDSEGPPIVSTFFFIIYLSALRYSPPRVGPDPGGRGGVIYLWPASRIRLDCGWPPEEQRRLRLHQGAELGEGEGQEGRQRRQRRGQRRRRPAPRCQAPGRPGRFGPFCSGHHCQPEGCHGGDSFRRPRAQAQGARQRRRAKRRPRERLAAAKVEARSDRPR